MKKNLIYIDDEPINLMIFEKMFSNNFDVKTFESPLSALDYIKQTNEIDIICSDQRMPVMTGLELFSKIFELYTNEPPLRLLITGFGIDDKIQQAMDNKHFDVFIRKPWNQEQLMDIFQNK